ncbi:MAG: Mrr restriction system protein [Myxococcaceae bacterium]|nr:Mrr restriction system protein [Myxococcaceae bacterium]
MGIPTYDLFIEPLLRYLCEHAEPVPTRDVYGALATRVALTEEDRQQMLPSRAQPVYQNRIGWAHDRLKRAGLSHSPRRSQWQLTEAGRRYVADHARPLSSAEVEKLAEVDRDSRLRDSKPVGSELPPPGTLEAKQSPDERIEAALLELRETTAAELLEYIFAASPEFFEHLVLELLHSLGYGTSKADLFHTGKSGDGGIDGIISLDRLGLEKVYVQAKRWKNSVGRPDVQAFFGALAGHRATKGVFITTSTYSREAREFADSVSVRIPLNLGSCSGVIRAGVPAHLGA